VCGRDWKSGSNELWKSSHPPLFYLLVFEGPRGDGDGFHDRGVFFFRIVAVVAGEVDDFLDNIHAFDHLPEDGVLTVEVGRCFVHEEEL